MKNIESLTKWCVWFCYAFVAMELVYFWFTAKLYKFFTYLEGADSPFVTEAEFNAAADQLDQQGVYVGAVYLVVILISMVLNAFWLYRASFNSSILHPTEDRIKPGWAVGWFFVPIFSLWKPYYAVREMWNSTVRDDGNIHAKAPGFFAVWWTAWLLSNAIAQSSSRAASSDNISTLQVSNVADLINTPITIVSIVLFLRIIRRVSAIQIDVKDSQKAEIFA